MSGSTCRLRDLVFACEQRAQAYDLPAWLRAYPLARCAAFRFTRDPYYARLAALVELLGAKQVMEFGTEEGGSALALCMAGAQVLTYDLDPAPLRRSRLGLLEAEDRLLPLQLAAPEAMLQVSLQGVDLIFVDIDHSGVWEAAFHRKCQAEYTGIVAWDDVQLNRGMRTFWATVTEPKVTLTWHFSGFGLVQYGSQRTATWAAGAPALLPRAD